VPLYESTGRERATYGEHRIQAVEGLFFDHVAQQQGGDKTHALAVSHLRVEGRVPGKNAPQRLLARPAITVEHLVLRKGAVDVASDLLRECSKEWLLRKIT